MARMTMADKFRAIAAELRAHPEHWTQGVAVRNAAGMEIRDMRPEGGAVCWCSIGFLERDFDELEFPNALQVLDRAAATYLAEPWRKSCAIAFNDAPGRRATEIALVFERAATMVSA